MNIDEKSLRDGISKNNADAQYVEKFTNEIVDSCCDKLDGYIDYVANRLNDENYNLTNDQLDDIVMTIPTLLYFVGTQQEKLGIKRDVSKQTRLISFNEAFSNAEGIQALKKCEAENKVFYESMVLLIYENAYNIIKAKVDNATEVLQSAKKVLTRRMTESELTRSTPNKDRW